MTKNENYKSSDNLLLKYSKIIDDIDMFLGPVSTLAIWHENETINHLGIAATVLDLAIKTPFVAIYTLSTRDYKSPIAWLGWEALAHVIPYEGGLLSIRRTYEKDTKNYFK